jgi:hypothetical protein
MGIFGSIVLSEALLMMAGQAKLPEGRSIGAQLVGDEQFRRKALLPEKLGDGLYPGSSISRLSGRGGNGRKRR